MADEGRTNAQKLLFILKSKTFLAYYACYLILGIATHFKDRLVRDAYLILVSASFFGALTAGIAMLRLQATVVTGKQHDLRKFISALLIAKLKTLLCFGAVCIVSYCLFWLAFKVNESAVRSLIIGHDQGAGALRILTFVALFLYSGISYCATMLAAFRASAKYLIVNVKRILRERPAALLGPLICICLVNLIWTLLMPFDHEAKDTLFILMLTFGGVLNGCILPLWFLNIFESLREVII